MATEISTVLNIADNFIYCNIETDTVIMGKIKFDNEIIKSCARAVADYLKHNREKIAEVSYIED